MLHGCRTFASWNLTNRTSFARASLQILRIYNWNIHGCFNYELIIKLLNQRRYCIKWSTENVFIRRKKLEVLFVETRFSTKFRFQQKCQKQLRERLYSTETPHSGVKTQVPEMIKLNLNGNFRLIPLCIDWGGVNFCFASHQASH